MWGQLAGITSAFLRAYEHRGRRYIRGWNAYRLFALPDFAQPVNIDVVQSREVEIHLDGQELMESSLVVEDRLNLLLVHNRCLFLFHLLSVLRLTRASVG